MSMFEDSNPPLELSTITPQYQCTYRSPQTQAAYDSQEEQRKATSLENNLCALCDKDSTRISVEEMNSIRVIKNDFPYDTFIGLKVKEHLLVISRRHVRDLGQLTDDEQADYWRACAIYSDRGYTLLTQATSGSRRSIPDHVHTHLVLCHADN